MAVAAERLAADPRVEAAVRDAARRWFLPFVKQTKPKYHAEPVHRYVAGKLTQFLRDVEAGTSPRLMLFMPPQEGKSELVSRQFTPWVLGQHPDWRIGLVSYGAELAEDMSRDARRIIEGQAFQALYPELRLDPSSRAVSDWQLDGQPGGMRAIGIGGAITGRSVEILIVDDPVKGRNEVDRDTYRDEQWAWWPQAVDRVQEGGGIVVLCTRWHHDDLPGRLLKQAQEDPLADQWDVVALPALAEEHDPLGRAVGEPLAPFRHSLAKLRNFKAILPERDWQAKFCQRPTADEGAIFKEAWFRYEDAPPDATGWVFIGADTAYSASKTAAYTVMEVWRAEKTGFRLLDVYRDRPDYPTLRTAALGLHKVYRPMAFVIEDAASGKSLLQELTAETRLPVVPWKPLGDKVNRAHAVTPLFASRSVILPKAAPWLREWVKEHKEFPASAYKDQVDTTSLSLMWAQQQGWFDQMHAPRVHTFTVDKQPSPDATGLYADLGITAGR